MKELIVNGRFTATAAGGGIQRFSLEVLREFAKREDLHVIVAMPENGEIPPIVSENIEYVKIGGDAGTKWEQFTLPRFCKKKKLPLLCMGNAAPLFFRASVVLHDMYSFDADPSREAWVRSARKMIKGFVNHNRNLFTVSEFSKESICAHFPNLKNQPIVVPDGHEHVFEWREEPVENVPEHFYLAVGSPNANKNLDYVIKVAADNPDKTFVLTGGSAFYQRCAEKIRAEHIGNLLLVGYMTEGQLLRLYRRCEGFFMPSLYEGFGLPPLEAVACGCRKLYLSNIPVFREIYGDCAVFFDPKDYEHTVSLDFSPMPEEAARKLLEKYSWKRTADILIKSVFAKEKV